MTTDERAQRRLGIEIAEGGEYVISAASGGRALAITPINQPSSAVVRIIEPIRHASAARLPAQSSSTCAGCGDTLPDGARFCITCSAPVAATGKTERL